MVISRNQHGEVIQFMMGKKFGDIVPFSMAVYYVDGIMIDSGPFTVNQEMSAAMEGLPVNKVVNTHHHEDHVGNNLFFHQRGIPVYAHQLTVPLNENPDLWTGRLMEYQYLLFDCPPACPCQPLNEYVEGIKYRYRIIHTPGHAHDHICLLDEEHGWLFTGDLFRGEKVKNLRVDEDVHETIESLEHLLNYDFDTMYCCSGRVFDNAKQRIRNKLDWWHDIHQQALTMEQAGYPLTEIRDRLLGTENIITDFTKGDSSKLNMIASFLKKK